MWSISRLVCLRLRFCIHLSTAVDFKIVKKVNLDPVGDTNIKKLPKDDTRTSLPSHLSFASLDQPLLVLLASKQTLTPYDNARDTALKVGRRFKHTIYTRGKAHT